ncbi:MAG: hypothetical protein ACK4Z9_07935 [Thermodesulfovibrionales bacterium]
MATSALENLPKEELEKIVRTILETYFKGAIEEFVRKNEERAKELSLIERIIRVEEELKSLREIESARFEATEKRFEALQREMNARFEAMDKRFEAIEKRFSFMQWFMGIGFTIISILIALFGLRGG